MNGHLSKLPAIMLFFAVLYPLTLSALPPDEYIDENPDFEDILSDLPQGFDLFSASESELRGMQFLAPEDIQNIVSMRDSITTGDSRDETGEISERIQQLDKIKSGHERHKIKTRTRPPICSVRTGILLNHDEKVSEGRQYLKIKTNGGEGYQFSIIGEHDPFEPRTFDLISLGFSIPLERVKSRLVLGDFRPGYGMGLLFARYRDFFGASQPRYYSSTSLINTSFEETRFMRGGMLVTRTGPFESQIWSSFRRIDATLDGNGNAVSIDTSGLHLGGSDRDNLRERIGGANLALRNKRGEISLTGAVSQYEPGFSRRNGEQYFGYPESSMFHHMSAAGKTHHGPLTFSFEHARMDGGKNATIAGITAVREKAKTCILFRNYSTGYWAPRAGAPSSFGSMSNERGIYSSIGLKLPAKTSMNASLDISRMLGRSYTRTMPASRKRMLCSIRKRILPRLDGSILFRSTGDTESKTTRRTFRGRVENIPGATHHWGFRVTAAWSEEGGKGGPFAEAAFSRMRRGRGVSISAGAFQIPTYECRYYAYVPDVPGRGRTDALWGSGYFVTIVSTIGHLSGRFRLADSELMTMRREIILQTDFSF